MNMPVVKCTQCVLIALTFSLIFHTSLTSTCPECGGPAAGLPREPNVHSPYYLMDLTAYELDLANSLLDFHEELSKTDDLAIPVQFAQKIEEYLHRYTGDIIAIYQSIGVGGNSTDNDANPVLVVPQNPILSFKMICRFVRELRGIHKDFLKFGKSVSDETSAKAYFSNVGAVAKWPTESALDESIVRILRIQMVYDLDPKDLASGIIMGTATGAKLSISQCLKIGTFAHTLKQYSSSIPWLELAIEKVNANELNDVDLPTYANDIQEYLNGVIAEHDKNWEAIRPPNNFFYTKKLVQNNKLLKSSHRIPFRKVDHSAYFRKKGYQYNEFNYWSLCSGTNHQTEMEKSELHCWYETKSDLALTISPVKTEVLSKTPRIIQIYDVIKDMTISELEKWGDQQRLAKSKTATGNTPETPLESRERTSVESRINKPFTKLESLIESIMGLDVGRPSSGEPSVLALYAPGGHFDCHLDAFEVESSLLNGNRMATIMFYLETTEKGGMTAFPQAGVAALPIKGSAVFWYNLKRSGDIDRDTYHCACPVVLGRKQITTKWLGSFDQILKRPCGLRMDE